MGKGSSRRAGANDKAYAENYEKVFPPKQKPKQDTPNRSEE